MTDEAAILILRDMYVFSLADMDKAIERNKAIDHAIAALRERIGRDAENITV